MAIDLAKVKARLSALKDKNTKTNHLWKPTVGVSKIRIIPYAHDTSNPFIELYFHYNVNNKTYLSPSSFQRPDPIVEFSNKLKKSGDKEEWKMGKSLEPKLRTYVPVLVRGLEHEGVKFWGFGKDVYQQLLSVISDDEYGDITDVKNGRDITVEFTAATGEGTFPKTEVRVSPKQTPAFDPSNTDLINKVKNQKNILEIFPELSYEDLEKVMEAWINPASAEVVNPPEEGNDESAGTEPVDAENTSHSVQETVDQFDKLFNS